jgi:hypothetical protein
MLVLGLVTAGCGGSSPSPATQLPWPAIDILLPSADDDDPALAACVAHEIASLAEREANRRQLQESDRRRAEIDAATRAEEADRARSRTASAKVRAQAAAAANPGNQAARRAAGSSSVAARQAYRRSEWSQQRLVAASRARSEIAGSARVAGRFADLAAGHETLFEVASKSASEGLSEEQREIEERALRSIRAIAASNPDLESLYIERYLLGYEAPADRCR